MSLSRFTSMVTATLCCMAPSLSVFAQLGPDTPSAVAPFLNGVLPSENPNREGAWEVVPQNPQTLFPPTLAIGTNPNDGDLWVGARRGPIRAMSLNGAGTGVRLIVDLTDRVAEEGGLIGIAFHPEFGQNTANGRYFYLYYASKCALDDALEKVDLDRCVTIPPYDQQQGFYGAYLRLSRFEYFEGASKFQVKSSEKPMINIRLLNDSHRGGGPFFGDDGYLHLIIGDQQIPESAQDLRTNLHGGLRLAVDINERGGGWACPAGSHKPRRTFQDHFNHNPDPHTPGHADELSGAYYCIPNDNPWLDPTAAERFEEYFSIGHRNPHRTTVDAATGRFWSGDVGENLRDEVNVVVSGGNYGWPCREGLLPGRLSGEPYCQGPLLGDLTDPVIDFTRDEALALIGGYVYRGTRFPDLYGKYLAGGYVLGHIYAIDYEPATGLASKTRLTTWTSRSLVTWGQSLDGEVYLANGSKRSPLHTLSPAVGQTPQPPATLSGVGAFSDLASLEPAPYWLPYTLNQSFWSDGANKSRWIALPAGEKIRFAANANWEFPVGTVLMKHFDLPLDDTDASVSTRLETRFLVHGRGGWYGITYRWNAAQTDAVLLSTGDIAEYRIATGGGGMRTQRWQFPSPSDCMLCHNTAVGGPAGPRMHTLNGEFTYPNSGQAVNQLLSWNQLDWFEPGLDAQDVPGYLAAADVNDMAVSLAHRARSWLDINCSNCHRPGGPGDRAAFDLRLTTPFVSQGLVNQPVLQPLGLPRESLLTPGCSSCSVLFHRIAALDTTAMPPLAKNAVDNEALPVIEDWILSLDPGGPPVGEVGTVSVRQNDPETWHTVRLENSYVTPVVVFGAVSLNGGQPAFVRVRNVDSRGFEFQVSEWSDQDGRHAREDLSYLVVEAGTHVLEDGRRLTSGVTDADKNWWSIEFAPPFVQTPVVFSQVVIRGDSNPVVTRQDLVSVSGFEIRLEEEEARASTPRGPEKVHWVAIESAPDGIEVGVTARSYNHVFQPLQFARIHAVSAPFMAAMQSAWGRDPVVLRYRLRDEGGAEMLVQEEATADREIAHTRESIGYAVFPEAGSVR